MAFDISQINDGRLNKLYKALEAEEKFRRSLVRDVAKVVPKSQIPTKAAKVKVLDLANQVSTTDGGYTSMSGASTGVDTVVNDRSYDVKKISFKKEYPRGMEGDALFDSIRNEYMPMLDSKIKGVEDQALATVLKGNGTAGDNQDVTVRTLLTGSNEDWADDASTPLEDIGGALDDTAGNLIVLGTNRARDLQTHPDIKTGSGFPSPTQNQLAAYFSAYFGVDEVIIGQKLYQNGSVTDAWSAGQIMDDVAYVGNKGNILFLNWSGPEFETDVDIDTNIVQFVGRAHSDLVTLDPDASIAFQYS